MSAEAGNGWLLPIPSTSDYIGTTFFLFLAAVAYKIFMDIYIRMLTKTISAASNVKEEPLYISALTIKKIIDLLRRAFQYAVNRDLVAQNPFENAVLPKTDILKKGVREIDY